MGLAGHRSLTKIDDGGDAESFELFWSDDLRGTVNDAGGYDAPGDDP